MEAPASYRSLGQGRVRAGGLILLTRKLRLGKEQTLVQGLTEPGREPRLLAPRQEPLHCGALLMDTAVAHQGIPSPLTSQAGF